jgi:O-antigen/teichoic acid export membrane protein
LLNIKKIVINLASGWLVTFVAGLVGLFMVPFLLKEMGTDYAVVVILLSISGLVGLADFGTGQSLTRELAAAIPEHDSKKISAIVSSGLFLYLCLGSVGSLIYYAGVPYLLGQFWGGDFESFFFAFRVYGVTTILTTFLSQSWITVISAYQRFDIVNSVRITGLIVLVAAQVIIIPISDEKILVWIMLVTAVPIVSCLILFYLARKIEDGFSLSFQNVSRSQIKSILGLSGKLTLLQFTRLISEKMDPFILAVFTSPLNLVVYNSAAKISCVSGPIITTIPQQLCPRATQLHVRGEMSQLREILTTGTRYSMLLGVGIFVGIVFLSRDFCALWLGENMPDGWLLVAELMIGMAIIDFITFAAGGTQWSILLGMRKLGFQIWTMVPTAILNLGLSVYLVSSTTLGVKGVILATLGIAIIRRPIMIIYTSRLVGLSTISYLRESYLQPVIVLALTSFSAFLIGLASWPDTWLSLVLKGASIGGPWLIFVWLIGLSKQEKKRMIASIRVSLTKVKI